MTRSNRFASVEMQQVRHFVSLIDHGSFHRAAEVLHISQPGLTRSIKRLEQQLGEQLIVRTHRGIHANEFGRVFYEYAMRVSNETRGLAKEFAELRGRAAGEIRIGIAANFTDVGLARVLADFAVEHPGVSMTVAQGFFSEIVLKSLRRGEVDVALGLWPNDWPATDMLVEPLTEVVSRIVCGPRSAFHVKRRASLRELSRVPWAMTGLNESDRFLSRMFQRHTLEPPTIAFRTSSITLLTKTVEQRNLVTLLPESVLEHHGTCRLACLDTDVGEIRTTAVVACLPHTAESAPHRKIISLIKRYYRSMIGGRPHPAHSPDNL